MLVNAHDFPGPALFQGLGLIAVSIWALWLYLRDSNPRPPKEDHWQRRYEEYQATRNRHAEEDSAP
jgi:hypothetical protein